MTDITPAPKYPKKALDDSMSIMGLNRRHNAEALEKVKTGNLQVIMKSERSSVGRLYAHLKHNDMKNFIRGIKKKEGSLKEEEESVEKKAERIMIETKQAYFDDIKIDDEFHLPYDLGFDHVIKERADQINE